MAQWVKGLAVKPDNLSSIPKLTQEKENQSPSTVLYLPHVYYGIHIYMYTHTQNEYICVCMICTYMYIYLYIQVHTHTQRIKCSSVSQPCLCAVITRMNQTSIFLQTRLLKPFTQKITRFPFGFLGTKIKPSQLQANTAIKYQWTTAQHTPLLPLPTSQQVFYSIFFV